MGRPGLDELTTHSQQRVERAHRVLVHHRDLAAAHGAQFLYGGVLFLMPSAYAQFLPFLEREFPRLAKRYKKLYARSAYLNGEYKEEISKTIAELRARCALDGRRDEAPLARKYQQLALAL